MENEPRTYADEIKEIIADIKKGVLRREFDEKGCCGLWDLAGQISINRQLKELQPEQQEAFTPVFADEIEQTELFCLMWDTIEASIN